MAIGQTEIILIVLAIVLLFGATAIPRLARSLGRAKGEFQQAKGEFDKAVKEGESDAGPSEDAIRRTARDLGIDDAGLSLAEVKKALNEKTRP